MAHTDDQAEHSDDDAIETDLDYLSYGGWRPTIEKLIQKLRCFRRFDTADLLEAQMRNTADGPSLDQQQQALSRISTELANLYGETNPDLSDNQREELQVAVGTAIRLASVRLRRRPRNTSRSFHIMSLAT